MFATFLRKSDGAKNGKLRPFKMDHLNKCSANTRNIWGKFVDHKSRLRVNVKVANSLSDKCYLMAA